jgi:hypothetical protein
MTNKINIPKLNPVSSNAIGALGHDGQGSLFVRFKGGGLYRYSGVSLDQYNELRKAESVGKHLQVNILRHRTGELVQEPTIVKP